MADPLVFTSKGLIPRSKLTVRDIVDEHATARRITTEYLLDGEVVRRSVWDAGHHTHSRSGLKVADTITEDEHGRHIRTTHHRGGTLEREDMAHDPWRPS